MIGVGDRAPDAHFLGAARELVRLSDFWRERPTIFLFLRHFG